VWIWPLTFIKYRNEQSVELYLHSNICLHGMHRDNSTFKITFIYIGFNLISGYLINISINGILSSSTVIWMWWVFNTRRRCIRTTTTPYQTRIWWITTTLIPVL
jgi:hypothetical protein